MAVLQTVTLHCTEGTSDKIYKLSFENAGNSPNLYVVNYANARRGAALTMKPKTKAATSYSSAIRLYEDTIKEKLAKGYKIIDRTSLEISSGDSSGDHRYSPPVAPAVIPVMESLDSGQRVMLCNPIDAEEAEALIKSGEWILNQKFDGERRMVTSSPTGEVSGINRKGQLVTMMSDLKEALNELFVDQFIVDSIFDAEQIGENLVIFDCLRLGKIPYENFAVERRLEILHDALAGGISAGSPITIAPYATDTQSGLAMLERMRQENAEGVVLKRKGSFYAPGRPASGGDWRKLKFYKTLSAIVGSVNTKRSVAMVLIDDNKPINVGNVTIPPNAEIPFPGDVIEVRYLYAYPQGSLYQPQFLSVRTDIDKKDCHAGQRIFKAA